MKQNRLRLDLLPIDVLETVLGFVLLASREDYMSAVAAVFGAHPPCGTPESLCAEAGSVPRPLRLRWCGIVAISRMRDILSAVGDLIGPHTHTADAVCAYVDWCPLAGIGQTGRQNAPPPIAWYTEVQPKFRGALPGRTLRIDMRVLHESIFGLIAKRKPAACLVLMSCYHVSAHSERCILASHPLSISSHCLFPHNLFA